MDSGAGTTRDESPPLPSTTRSTILGSFLRGRPRNTSQSHIERDLSPSPPQPPSPPPNNSHQHRRNRPAIATAPTSTTTPSGLGISHILRRRRSAGTIASTANTTNTANTANTSPTMPPPQTPHILQALLPPASTPLATSTSAPARPLSTLLPFVTTTTTTTTTAAAATATTPLATAPNPTAGSHRIRLVPHLDSRRTLRFDAIGRDLREHDQPLRIGRFTDRSGMGLAAVNALGTNKLAFKSKVVSRAHAEIWVEGPGKFFIRDTKSSSGTFLNHIRLSPANTESRPYQMKDGDILQLGVDYQGGTEDIYKSVKIRVEVGREWQSAPNAFNTNALKNLKTLAVAPIKSANGAVNGIKPLAGAKSQIPDCCICLFSVTIRQALFIAPCSHTFHYKCIRPLLETHHPAFSCPLCRTFADLEDDVEVETDHAVWEESDLEGEGEAVGVVVGVGGGVMVQKDIDGEREREREREREAGLETETEGDNPAPNPRSRTRTSRLVDEEEALVEEGGDEVMLDVARVSVSERDSDGDGDATGSGGGSAGGSGEGEGLIDEMGLGMGMGMVVEMGEEDDVDGTVGGKRKR